MPRQQDSDHLVADLVMRQRVAVLVLRQQQHRKQIAPILHPALPRLGNTTGNNAIDGRMQHILQRATAATPRSRP